MEKNVKKLNMENIKRIDDLRELEIKRVDEKFRDVDAKYQIQFTAAKEAVGIASSAQEKLVAQALDGTKEAITKADVATDKRFELLSDQIRALSEVLNKNAGAQGIYVTHTDLNIFGEKMLSSFEAGLKPLAAQVSALTAAQNNQQGKSNGISASWGILLGSVSLIGTLLAIFFALSK